MRIAMKLLFVAERKICDQIFNDINVLKDCCFVEVTTDNILMLFSFEDTIAKSKGSPKKLFVLLDMYEIMKNMFEMRDATHNLLGLLAQETFGDFKEEVEEEATKTNVMDGTMHLLTSYVINNVKFLFNYQSTLKPFSQEFENVGEDSTSQLATVIM
ncbi:hypothetical protein M5K25_021105 [Dendrobium thyrsiflorum]|uniref:Exocyst subunit Exo70 family protein n=1 Tax=Dendrobium thyrsiflorum TaxID=117978 RepID=A0ABD0UIL7_DENTH